MNVNKYLYTTAYYKIKDLIINNPGEDVFVIRGGQGASKTISIIQLIIKSLVKNPKEASIVSSELSKMKRTVIRDYNKVCKDWNIYRTDKEWNKSESKHEYFNNAYLDFLGADVNDIGKGFRRDILYINEADKMDIDTAVQFISRAGLTIIDYNPDKLFWGDEYINDNNFITLTFEDNDLTDSERRSILDYKTKGFFNPDLPFELLFKDENIKSKYWANKWRVYGLGLVGSIDGVVFENWSIGKFNPNGLQSSCGLDFGFSVDPDAMTEVAIDDKRKIIYLKELIYKKGMLLGGLSELIKAKAPGKLVIADSAESRLIADLKAKGINIKPANKGRIEDGVMRMQDYHIIIDPSSINLIREFETYIYSDKTSKLYVDANNHGIDGSRYNITYHLDNPNKGKYVIR